MAAGSAGEAAGANSSPVSKAPPTFVDLPIEAQQEILEHCSDSDLICVALVSKHFRELASSILYRDFHISFTDDDDINFEAPTDGLAGGLDTLTASEYNYAKHLRSIFLDTLSAGVKGERSYQSYLYSASCGKFLNTLLYLTLKKARSLEAFRWNIRVELSRPVYQELHRIPSLKHLHLRMQAGESYYTPPPPLPVSIDDHVGPSNHWPQLLPPSPGPPPGFSPPLPTNSLSVPSGPPPALMPPSKTSLKSKASRRGLAPKEPSTLSGFRDLKTLSVLDIDELDIVTELKTCIRNSSSTLNELQLSFSDSLAMQARRPSPDSDPDESDVEDDFGVAPASPNSGYETTGPARAFRAQEERNLQEGVLGKLLDVEPLLVKKPQMQPNLEKPMQSPGPADDQERAEPSTDPRVKFMSSIRDVSSRLMSLRNGSRDLTLSQEDMLDTISKAARKYVDSDDKPGSTSEASNARAGSNDDGDKESQTAQSAPRFGLIPRPPIGQAILDQAVAGDPANEGEKGQTERPNTSAKASKRKGNASEVLPEDIDIEHLESVEDGSDSEDQHPLGTETKIAHGHSASTTTGVSGLTSSKVAPASGAADTTEDDTNSTVKNDAQGPRTPNPQEHVAVLRDNARGPKTPETASDRHGNLETGNQPVEPEKTVSSQRSHAERGNADAVESKQAAPGQLTGQRNVQDYVRETRGFSLESLSIHLIPVKASVLSRAINLSCLKQLTLLNVGNQTAIWTLLAKENKETPLALRSVFTDNVSTAFLACMSKLPELHELFLLERSAKMKPETFAPRSLTTIDQIRRLVLKKHMPSLRRLMIKDESNGPNWDVNEKAMMLICTRGVKLEELAVSMKIHAVHAFMQYFSNLVNLRAIHILHFKNNDTCMWVQREILKFIVDNLSHNPELQLEWIAIEDDRVDQVIRPAPARESDAEEERTEKSEGKKKAAPSPPPAAASEGLGDHFPPLPADGLDSDSDSDSDSDNFDTGTHLRFKTMGPVQYYDIKDIKIFEKEIRSGRL